jgi:ribosomal protein S18 acetylase RimI-like enzyme
MLAIRHARGESDIAVARRLFEEYAAWIAIDLSFQNFAEELRLLPGEYAPPQGALFLGWADARPAGCIAVRRIDDDDCEMKRLYVRDACRGVSAGEQLAREAIEWARAAGYRQMRLDTLPAMRAAHKLYERLGFVETPAYRFNPVEGTRFLALSLGDR